MDNAKKEEAVSCDTTSLGFMLQIF